MCAHNGATRTLAALVCQLHSQSRMKHATWLVGPAVILAVLAACGSDEGVGTDHIEEKSAAERFCDTLSDYVNGCGPKSPCDEGLVNDCADVAGILSDGYLSSAEKCIRDGIAPTSCLVSAVSGLQPSAAHRAFAETFCGECAFGVSGCVEAFFAGGTGDTQLVGNLVLPLGDGLVQEIAAECASGLTCLATFASCAQGVLAKRAIPEATVSCLLSPPPPSDEAAQPCTLDDGSGETSGGTTSGTTTSGGATSSGASSGDTTSGSSGEPPHECSYQSTWSECSGCCADAEGAAYYQFENHLLNECACKIAAPCNGMCPDLCNGGAEFDDACVGCLNTQLDAVHACVETALTNCWDDATCAPVLECVVQCPEA
jgi:hypothetical protein